MNIAYLGFYFGCCLALVVLVPTTEACWAAVVQKVIQTVAANVIADAVTSTVFGDRKRRSLDVTPSTCSCTDSLHVGKFNISTLQHLDQTKVNIEISGFNDVYGYPLYDVIKILVHERKVGQRYVKVTREEYYLYTDARECDCTSMIHAGNLSLSGDVENGNVVHGVLSMKMAHGKDDKVMHVTVVISAVVLAVILVSIVTTVVMKRKKSQVKGDEVVKGDDVVRGDDAAKGDEVGEGDDAAKGDEVAKGFEFGNGLDNIA